MKHVLLAVALLICASTHAKTVKITAKNNYQKDASLLGLTGGDSLLISENIASLYLNNLKGTSNDKRITVLPANPNILIGGKSNYSIWFVNCAYITFKDLVIKGDTNAINKVELSRCITFTGGGVDGAAVGLEIKTNPQETDPLTWYPNKMDSIVIENHYAKNCGAEGYYLGHTFSAPLYGQLPPYIDGLVLRNVYTENTGWDGFQITNARNIDADGIRVKNAGWKRKDGQSSGITIQDATTGVIKNMTVDGAGGTGLMILGKQLDFYNITLQGVTTNGVFIDNRSDRGQNLGQAKINITNLTILTGGTGKPIDSRNSAQDVVAAPGVFLNVLYDQTQWKYKISDANNSYIAGTEGKPLAPIDGAKVIKSVTITYMDGSTTTTP